MTMPRLPPTWRIGSRRAKALPEGQGSRGAAVAVNRATVLAAGATILLVLAVTYDHAQNEMNVQFHHFQDTRGVTVLSPTVDLTQDFTDRTTLRVNFGVDAISGASDSCARCHREGVNS